MEDKKKDELAQIRVDKFLSACGAKKYGLSSYETLVLLYLANRIGKKQECWSKKTVISSYTGLPVRTLERAIQSLKSKNLIFITRKGKLNYYSFTLLITAPQADDQLQDSRPPGGHDGSIPAPQADEPSSHPPTRRAIYNNSLQSNNSLEANNSLMFTDVNVSKIFEQFWECYPRKQNKNKARKLWKNKNLDKQIDLIVADITKRKQEDHQWKSKQFIPLATTYLNGERWNDEIIKQEQKKQTESPYVKNEIRSTVQEWNPEKLQYVKTEEEIKKSDVVRESHMAKINKLIGRRK